MRDDKAGERYVLKELRGMSERQTDREREGEVVVKRRCYIYIGNLYMI